MGLTVPSDYLQLTFINVVEHILEMSFGASYRSRYADKAVEAITTLLEKSMFWELIDVSWVDGLLGRAVEGGTNQEVFAQLLRLRGLGVKARDEQIVVSENLIPEDKIFDAISGVIVTGSKQEGWWNDGVVYGGLTAMRSMPKLGSHVPDANFLRALSDAVEAREGEDNSGVRKVASDVILVARDAWRGYLNL